MNFLLAAVLVAAACGQSSTVATSPNPGGKLVAQIHENDPHDVAAGFGSIWIANGKSGTVTRLDPATNKIAATIYMDDPSVLAVAADSIWVTSFDGNSVSRIDPVSNKVVGSVVPGGQAPVGIAVFDGYIWVANHQGSPTGSLAKIDPAKMKVVDLIYLGSAPAAGPMWIAIASGSLWVNVPNINAVVRIDPKTDMILATIPDQAACGEMVADDDDVWVAGGCGPGVTHIDPTTNKVDRLPKADGTSAPLALGAGSLWYGTTTILGRFNTTTHKVVGQLKLPGPSCAQPVQESQRNCAFGATFAFGNVWVTDLQDELLFKVEPT